MEILNKSNNSRGKEIENLLEQLKVNCYLVAEEETLCSVSYYYKFLDALSVLKIERAVGALEVLLCLKKGQIYYEPTNTQQGAQFALHIAKNGCKSISISNFKSELAKMPFTYGLGVDQATGQLITTDLLKTPHLLIGGASGSGKSVLLNNIISSLKEYHPQENTSLILIDTKQVDFARWNKFRVGYELACDISYTVQEAKDVLKSVCVAMDKRYTYMREKGLTIYDGTKWIIVIDEFADLMLSDKNIIEPYIVRIAQMGRACGIHLIIATQRPTVDVCTGLIKANIPDRIALKCASARDSMVILGNKGAENLNNVGEAIISLNNKVCKAQLFNK